MSTTSLQPFFDLTVQGTQILSALCQLLEEEKTVLSAFSATALEDLVARKNSKILAFEANIDARNTLIATLGYSPDLAGIEALRSTLPERQASLIGQAWDNLAAQLKHASALNKRNERIVVRNQKNLDQILAIMRGQVNKNAIYNQAGSKGNYSAQNRLGKA